ncbi:MAG: hypothetical protein MJY50_06675 [Bacteroidales bacterium]|nr:hypothetical protein [Bacteroidales bacterium]
MLEGLRQNVTGLLALYEGERQRADSLAATLSQTEKELESCRKQITDLNRKIDNIKLTGAFVPETGNPVAKERIEKLIREIDKCIRLLER